MHRLLTALGLTASLVCNAQTFWQGTTYGESVEQVQAKISGIGAPSVSAELSAKGIAALLNAPARLVERDFESYYYFSSRGLDRVILRRTALSPAAEAEATNSALIQALRLKYGRAKKTEDVKSSVLEGRAMWFMWTSGDTDILLVPQHGSDVLTLAYTLSERSKDRASERDAEKYRKKVDPKAEAAKL